jgi:hypothetical protein
MTRGGAIPHSDPQPVPHPTSVEDHQAGGTRDHERHMAS